MSFLLGKENWKLFSRKIKGFWEDYRRNKIGLVGLSMIIVYVVVALLTPWITPYAPLTDTRLAQSLTPPEWITIFPEASGLPRTIYTPIYWNISEKSKGINAQWGEQVTVNYLGGDIGTAHISLISNFSFPYDVPPKTFHITFAWAATTVENLTFALDFSMVSPNGTKQRLWWASSDSPLSGNPFVNSESYTLLNNLGFDPIKTNLAERIFSGKGDYSLLLKMSFMPTTEDATGKIEFEDGELRILGLVHGLLGTDQLGRDLFSQLIHGARISLIIGLLAAVISTSIGITVGVVAGYSGGALDEISMRVVDILLCLPVLPLLLTLMFLYGKSPYYLILIVAIFYWLGLARIVRSQTLSLREMPFVESAKAAGAGRFYVIFRHLIPNVLPVAFAHMVLVVPGAIIMEASLSFLGFGDPMTPTWGRMLNTAFQYGAFSRLAWWWILPPGLAIIGLCLAFVFVGHAVDEVANPRLRRRR